MQLRTHMNRKEKATCFLYKVQGINYGGAKWLLPNCGRTADIGLL